MSITFALAKGRLAKKTMNILEKLGITCSEMTDESRKLIFETEDKKYRFFLSKPSDVPTYVDHGVADIGIVGKDTILEEALEVYEVLDLGFGACRMMVAGEPAKKELLSSGKQIRVATKYPNIAQKYFDKSNRNVSIIKLNGSVELGPLVNLSDVIVDIVESGKTLIENGLEPLEFVADLSARVIVNKASIKVKHEEIMKIVRDMEGVINDRNN